MKTIVEMNRTSHRPQALNVPGHQRGGFTFVEVMIATAIILVMFTTFYAAMQQGLAIIRVARENLRATQIMESRMEGIRLYTWSQLTNTTLMPTNFTANYYPDGLSINGTNVYSGITYNGTVTVSSVTLTNPTPTYAANLYQVTVQLNWLSGGVNRSRQMSTYCGEYGIQNYVWSNPN